MKKTEDQYMRFILDGIAKGNENALGDLWRLKSLPLIRFAAFFVKSQENAEEIVSDVFVTIWRRRQFISHIDNFNVYLYVSVKNKSFDFLKSKKNLAYDPLEKETAYDLLEQRDPYLQLLDDELQSRMEHVVNELPRKCQSVFRMIREDGLSYKEVSKIMDISVKTIDAQMAIAVKRICTELNIKRFQKTRK